MLFNASRAQLVNEVIKPALGEGKVVICDRYTDSTVVYQGYGRGLDIANIALVNNAATGGLKPDITFLLDIAPKRLSSAKMEPRPTGLRKSPGLSPEGARGYLGWLTPNPPAVHPGHHQAKTGNNGHHLG